MIYADIRSKAKNGDVLLVEGKGFFSTCVRVLTGESISHVAMLFWMDGGLWVAEMVEGTGYRIMPASQWLDQAAGPVLWGMAPKVVHDAPGCIVAQVRAYRADRTLQRYGYLSLLKVWLAQLTGRQIPVRRRVCSTFVQEAWERCGFTFRHTADPGDFLGVCQVVAAIGPADA